MRGYVACLAFLFTVGVAMAADNYPAHPVRRVVGFAPGGGADNAARNVEIAVWKLSNARNTQGQLLLLSNESAATVANLSFEREFGKAIASLDILSKIAADKNNRTVVKIIQTIATAAFLPIK